MNDEEIPIVELTQAIKTRHAAFFKTAEFLQNKDLPNPEGLTPLMEAAKADLGVWAPPGVTALSIATKQGNAEAARILKDAQEVAG